MKIRQAPVADLLKYFNELYENRFNSSVEIINIIDIINNYYCSLTKHKTILPITDDILNDWCDLNHSDTMENCPNVPGVIVYKIRPNGSKMYGILYHSGYIVSGMAQMNYLSYYFAHADGHIGSHTFIPEEWDGWGVPIRYFSYPESDYIDSRLWELGERELTLHSYGHDVRQLQALLYKANPQVPLHGYFENNTLQALHESQSWCNIAESDVFVPNSIEGKKIIEFYKGK